jgi:hypothetical protein
MLNIHVEKFGNFVSDEKFWEGKVQFCFYCWPRQQSTLFFLSLAGK